MHGQSAAARAPKIRRYIFTVFAAAVRRAMTPPSGARGSFYNRQLTSGPPTARPRALHNIAFIASPHLT